jgi:hypothetical protein
MVDDFFSISELFSFEDAVTLTLGSVGAYLGTKASLWVSWREQLHCNFSGT